MPYNTINSDNYKIEIMDPTELFWMHLFNEPAFSILICTLTPWKKGTYEFG
jgi:hypothetical protein